MHISLNTLEPGAATNVSGRVPVLRSVDRADTRIHVLLNQAWQFRREGSSVARIDDESAWEQVHLPHAARLDPLNASGGQNFQGVCWYRRNIHGDATWAGRTLYLRLDGLMQVGDIWLNGHKLITHFGGYTPLTLDVTASLQLGTDNELLIRLDNTDNPAVPPGKPQAELDFVYFGGLSRDVSLEAVSPVHVSDPIFADRVAGGGVFVTCANVTTESAIVRVRTDLRNAHQLADRAGVLRHELIEDGGRIVAECEHAFTAGADDYTVVAQTLDVRQPRLWHPQHPDLYTLRTTVHLDGRAVDEVLTRIGIRNIYFDVDRGLLINGEKFLSIGANRHQDHPYVGYAMSAAAHWRDAKKLRDAGFTSYRSHYPQHPAFMDACDALGILAIVSNPGWQFVGDELFQERALRNARLMVRRDRNRPSVILWEAALNESDNRSLAADFHRAIHEEFPFESCYTAGDRNAHFVGPEHGDQPPSVWDVDYLHNDGTKPYWIREWGDQVDNWSDQQSANRVARGWGEGPMLTQVRAHLTRMDELFDAHFGTKTNNGKRLAGATLWAGIDCQRGYHHQPFYGGVMDAFRLPKFDHYLFQSQRPPVEGPSDGPMVFIANFATFLSPTAVTVFSNCEEVRLVHGDRVVETRTPDAGHRVPHPPFTFRIDRFADEQSTMYMTGVGGPMNSPVELRAEGLIGGKVVATHVVRPPGVAKKLTLEVDIAGRSLVADGADFVRVYARVCDARGTVCPVADDHVRFEVEGEASVIEAPDANPMRAEAGIATALIRATTRPGTIRVTATAFGLTPATLEFESESIV
jgi:beta-galactosidase